VVKEVGQGSSRPSTPPSTTGVTAPPRTSSPSASHARPVQTGGPERTSSPQGISGGMRSRSLSATGALQRLGFGHQDFQLKPSELKVLSATLHQAHRATLRTPIFDSRDAKANPNFKALSDKVFLDGYFLPPPAGESAFASFRRQLTERASDRSDTVVGEFLRKHFPQKPNPSHQVVAAHRASLREVPGVDTLLPRGTVPAADVHSVLKSFSVDEMVDFYQNTLLREADAVDGPLTQLEAEKGAVLRLPPGEPKNMALGALQVKFENFHTEHLTGSLPGLMNLKAQSSELLRKLGGMRFDEFTPEFQVTINQFTDLMGMLKQRFSKEFSPTSEVALLMGSIADDAARIYLETMLARLRGQVKDASHLGQILGTQEGFEKFIEDSQRDLPVDEDVRGALSCVPRHLPISSGVSPSLLPRLAELFGGDATLSAVDTMAGESRARPALPSVKLDGARRSAILLRLAASTQETMAGRGRRPLDLAYGSSDQVGQILKTHASRMTAAPALSASKPGTVSLQAFDLELGKLGKEALEELTTATLNEFKASFKVYDALTARRLASEEGDKRLGGDAQRQGLEALAAFEGLEAQEAWGADREAFYRDHMKEAMPRLFALEAETRALADMVGGLPFDEVGPDLRAKVDDMAASVEAAKLAVADQLPLKHPVCKLLECASDNARHASAQVSLIAGRNDIPDEAALQKVLDDKGATVQIMPLVSALFEPSASTARSESV